MNETYDNYTNYITGIVPPKAFSELRGKSSNQPFYYSGTSEYTDIKPKLDPIDVTEDSDFDWAKKICGFDKSKGERLYNVGNIEGEYDLQFVKSKLYKLNMAILGFETVNSFAFCKCLPYRTTDTTKNIKFNRSDIDLLIDAIGSMSKTTVQPF